MSRLIRIKSVTVGGVEVTLWHAPFATDLERYRVQENTAHARSAIVFRPTFQEAEMEFSARTLGLSRNRKNAPPSSRGDRGVPKPPIATPRGS